MMLVADNTSPPVRTAAESMTHFLPSRDQFASPKLPSASKVHERSWPVDASLPIIWNPLVVFVLSLMVISMRRNVFSPHHSYLVVISVSSRLAVQVPISQSRSRSEAPSPGHSRTTAMSHWPF